MSVLALLKLADEFYRLIFSTAYNGAIDLRFRHEEVQGWFDGRPLYEELRRLNYPPQAYLMLWPLMGWLDFGPARWLWALTSVAALAWMAVLVVHESLADTRREKIFIVLMLLSMNAVGVTIGNGQLPIHLLPAIVAATLLLHRRHVTYATDAWAACLMLVALVKPTLSVPLILTAIIARPRIRPAALIAIGYVLLTFLSAGFQRADVPTLIRQWWTQSRGAEVGLGYGDLHSGLAYLRLDEWASVGSIAMMVGLGIWTYRQRGVDVWVLMGVAALTARLWSYHRVYDDVLILIPLVALFRIAKRDPMKNGTDVTAAVLLGIGIAAMLAPARMEVAAPPLNWIFIGGHVTVWLAIMFFLITVARRIPTAHVDVPAKGKRHPSLGFHFHTPGRSFPGSSNRAR